MGAFLFEMAFFFKIILMPFPNAAAWTARGVRPPAHCTRTHATDDEDEDADAAMTTQPAPAAAAVIHRRRRRPRARVHTHKHKKH